MAHLVIRHITGIATKYDHRDALDRVERLREWYEDDPASEDVELPDIHGCLPESVNRHPLTRRTLSAIVPQIRDGRVRRMMELAIELDGLSHGCERPNIDREF